MYILSAYILTDLLCAFFLKSYFLFCAAQNVGKFFARYDIQH